MRLIHWVLTKKNIWIAIGYILSSILIIFSIYSDYIQGGQFFGNIGGSLLVLGVILCCFTAFYHHDKKLNLFASAKIVEFIRNNMFFIFIAIFYIGGIIFFIQIYPDPYYLKLLLAIPYFPFYFFIFLGFMSSTPFFQMLFLVLAFVFGIPILIFLWKTIFERIIFPKVNKSFPILTEMKIESENYLSTSKILHGKDRKFVFFVLLATYLVRFFVLFNSYPGWDTGHYWLFSDQLARGNFDIIGQWSSIHENPTSIIAALSMAVWTVLFGGNTELTYTIIIPLFSCIICYELISLVTRFTKNEKIGLFAGLFYAISFYQIWMSVETYPQFFSVFYGITGIFLIFGIPQNKKTKYLGFGFLALAAVYYFLLFIFVYYCYTYFLLSSKEEMPNKPIIKLFQKSAFFLITKILFIILLFFGVICFFYFTIFGEGLSNSLFNLLYYIILNLVQSPFYEHPSTSFIITGAGYQVTSLLFLFLALIGFFRIYPKVNKKFQVLLLMLLLLSFGTIFGGMMNWVSRINMYLDIFILIFAASGLFVILEWIKKKSVTRFPERKILTFLVISLIGGSFLTTQALKQGYLELRERQAIIWLGNYDASINFSSTIQPQIFSEDRLYNWILYYLGTACVQYNLWSQYQPAWVWNNLPLKYSLLYVIENSDDPRVINGTAFTTRLLEEAETRGYNVTQIYDQNSTNIYKVYIKPEPLQACFSANFSTVTVEESILFNETSLGRGFHNHFWNFNDGTPLLNYWKENPVHQFDVPGTYPVVLTVTDNYGGSSSVTHDVTVLPRSSPIANFTMNASSIIPGQTIQFTDVTIPTYLPLGYEWNFSDGSPNAIEPSPTHQFTTLGNYSVTLHVTDSVRQSSFMTQPVTVILDYLPIASFKTNYTAILPGERVAFNDTTTGGTPLLSYQWNFTDGSSNATEQNPVHQFNSIGIYSVVLTVTDSDGDQSVYTRDISVQTGLFQARFHWDSQMLIVNQSVQFTSDTIGGTSPFNYQWNFTDGTSNETIQDPTHQFTSEGFYSVILGVTDSDMKQCFAIQNIYVSPDLIPLSSFTVNASTLYDRGDVQFRNIASSGNPPITYTWNFTDGTPLETLPNPVHHFALTGTYNVMLNVTDVNGNSSFYYKQIAVLEDLYPFASFTVNSSSIFTKNWVKFTDSSTSGNLALIYIWNFGDGTVNYTGKNPVHQFIASGRYLVTLTVFDRNMDRSVYQMNITVADKSLMQIIFGILEGTVDYLFDNPQMLINIALACSAVVVFFIFHTYQSKFSEIIRRIFRTKLIIKSKSLLKRNQQ